MKTLVTILIVAFLSAPVMAGSVYSKGVFCPDINKGFFFEGENVVRTYRISGYEVMDWELDSYDEVGPYRIEWYYNGELFHLDRQTLQLNGMGEPCELVKSRTEMKQKISPLPFLGKTKDC